MSRGRGSKKLRMLEGSSHSHLDFTECREGVVIFWVVESSRHQQVLRGTLEPSPIW